MEKERGYNNRPPMLDGSNYDWWKVRMVAFLKSMDNRDLKVILKGWVHPVVKDKYGKKSIKLEEDQDENDDKEAIGNSKALNALFNGVDKNCFILINTCTIAKDA